MAEAGAVALAAGRCIRRGPHMHAASSGLTSRKTLLVLPAARAGSGSAVQRAGARHAAASEASSCLLSGRVSACVSAGGGPAALQARDGHLAVAAGSSCLQLARSAAAGSGGVQQRDASISRREATAVVLAQRRRTLLCVYLQWAAILQEGARWLNRWNGEGRGQDDVLVLRSANSNV
jgi:hypothetical protein